MSDSTRRELLKRGIVVLGSGLILQRNGGVVAAEGRQEKKDDTKKDKTTKKGADDKKNAEDKKSADEKKTANDKKKDATKKKG